MWRASKEKWMWCLNTILYTNKPTPNKKWKLEILLILLHLLPKGRSSKNVVKHVLPYYSCRLVLLVFMLGFYTDAVGRDTCVDKSYPTWSDLRVHMLLDWIPKHDNEVPMAHFQRRGMRVTRLCCGMACGRKWRVILERERYIYRSSKINSGQKALKSHRLGRSIL